MEEIENLWNKILNGESVLTEDIILCKNGNTFPAEVTATLYKSQNEALIFGFMRDITQRKKIEDEKKKLIEQLQSALSDVKKLTGLLPICSSCHKIKDKNGNWYHLERYIRDHSEADFSHGICPDCGKKLYKEYVD